MDDLVELNGIGWISAEAFIDAVTKIKASVYEQAISRSYRMGQSRNVLVYRLLTEDSIDAIMLEVLGEKADLFDLYARESKVASLALTEQAEAEEEKSLQQMVLKIEQDRLKQEVS